MTPQDNKSWEDELYKLVYEPEHESGLTCWCGPTYYKEEGGLTHLRHKEQRDVIKSFIHSTLNKEREEERNRLVEKVEKREVKVGKGSKKYGGYRCNGIVFADMKRARAYKGGYNQAIENILTILKENNK